MENNVANYISAITGDHRITTWHLAVYVALLKLWIANAQQNPFKISRRVVMQLAHVKSIVTYHKCVKELQQFNYIYYLPSYHPVDGSSMSIILK